MGDTLTSGHSGEEVGRDDASTRTDEDSQVFECPLCDARRLATNVRYDQLGYAICPVCSYADGP